MIYICWYLGIGLMVLAIVYTVHERTKDNALEELRDRIASFSPNRQTLSYRVLRNFVGPTITGVAIVLAWPVAIYRQIKQLRIRRANAANAEKLKFKVKSHDLRERLTVQEIETREIVLDPLRAVPELPFGHHNQPWQHFLKNFTEGDELWSFSAQWRPKWPRHELREGYVIAHNGTYGPYFLTVCKWIPEQED